MSVAGDEADEPNTVRPRRSSKGRGSPRTAKQVIDQAIEDNKHGEFVLYGFAIIFVL